MLVCHCHGICDRVIKECVREGARSPEEVSNACGAGGSCGGCRETIEDLVRHEMQRQDGRASLPVLPLVANG